MKKQKTNLLSSIKFWTTKTSPEQVRTNFNTSHYLKVLNAKLNKQ